MINERIVESAFDIPANPATLGTAVKDVPILKRDDATGGVKSVPQISVTKKLFDNKLKKEERAVLQDGSDESCVRAGE